MPDPVKANVTKVIPPTRSVPGLSALSALNEIVEAVRECVNVRETEKTNRTRLETYEKIEVGRIHAAEAILKDYFDQAFAERRKTFDQLFERFDDAVARGDGETMSTVVRGIVDVARESPLADLGDLSQIRAALDDPDQIWEL